MTALKPIPNDLIDSLLANYQKPEDIICENGLLKQLTKALIERALHAEMAQHFGHAKDSPITNSSGNTRNGSSKKRIQGEFGALALDIPRDRQGSFEPQILGKHQTRWTGFDDKILSMYARGMSVRDIQAHLHEMYGTEVSASLISDVTDAVLDDVKAWQNRPLDAIYPILYLDSIHVKVRDNGVVRNSLQYVGWKVRKAVAADLRLIYTAATAIEAEQRLTEFEVKWGEAYPPIGQSWRRNWDNLTPFFAYPPDIRKVIYTTNAIESLNMSLRKVTKTRGSFPNDEAAMKLFYLALQNISKKWTMPIRDWRAALVRFSIQFEERMPAF